MGIKHLHEYNILQVRGLGGGCKRAAIRRLVRKHKADMLYIQEIKREHIDKDICQALWGNQEVGWEFLPSINTAGGLLCVWNDQVFKTVRRENGRGFILLEGVWTVENQKTYIVNIYSPCDSQNMQELWEPLKQLRQQDPEGLWCFLDDFNSVRHHSEREGVSHRGGQANNISSLYPSTGFSNGQAASASPWIEIFQTTVRFC